VDRGVSEGLSVDMTWHITWWTKGKSMVQH
jgi:hypothetical protein